MAEPTFPPASSDLTLGRRLNNPLNIRQNNQGFLGESGDESGFVRFQNPEYGLRAADRVLNTYGRDYGIDTLEGLINRFAPPSENDSSSYLDFVSSQTGIGAQDKIDLTDARTRNIILPAMARIESRSEITPEMLSAARALDRELSDDEDVVSEQRAAEVIREDKQELDEKLAVTQVAAPWGAVYEITHPTSATERDIFRYVQQNRNTLDALELKPEPQEEIGIFETGLEVAKAPVRGFAKGLLSVPAGLAELADAATNTIGLEGLIDSGEENPLVAFSRESQQSIDESFLGRDPRTLDSFSVDVAEGLGSVATFLTPGAIGRAAGLAGKALQAAKVRGGIGIGVGLGAEQQQQMIEDARARGMEVTEGQEDLATALGGVIGLSEVALPFRLFNRINKTAPEGFKKKAIATLKEALASGSTEAVQEAMAGLAQEAVARGVYDETLEIGESFVDDFTVGGGVGVVADLITAAVGGRRSAATSEAKTKREEKLRQERDESLRRTLQERQQSTVEKAVESAQPFDPSQVPLPQDMSDPDAMLAYARNISQQMGYAFPDKTRFFVQDTPQGAVVVDENGVQYGMPVPEVEQAYDLASQLDLQMVDQAVRNTIRTNLEVFEDVDPDNMSTAIMYWALCPVAIREHCP